MRSKFFLFTTLFLTSLRADSFTALTYNILNKDFACQELYAHASLEDLDWVSRKQKIVQKLLAIHPDVICLQEVSYEAFKDLQEALSEYSGFLSINETNTTRNTGGICTFCKKTAFKKVSYSGLLCEGSSKCGKLAIRPALFAQLTLNNNAQVTIVNTKLRRCNVVVPNDGVWNHLHFLLKKIPKEFVLFMGDFNRPPGHFLIKDVMEAGLEDVFAKEGRPTCFANGIVKRIDYIFASKDLVTFPLSCSLLTDKEPIPNRNEPSDHVPILCHVTVK